MKLIKFPLPPSINKQLTLARGRFIKTSAARIFDSQVHLYKIKNFRKLDEIKEQLKNYTELKVEVYFVFHKDRLIGKKGQLKTLDVNNYLKSALDGLVKCIEVDDKFFISHHVEKMTCDNPSEEQIIFVLCGTSLKKYEASFC